MHFFPFCCVLCPSKFRFTRMWAFQRCSWSIRCHRMWRHIIRWLEPDVLRQCSGPQWLKFMVMSTLENETTYFLAKSCTRHPMTRRNRDLKSKFDQFKKFLWNLISVSYRDQMYGYAFITKNSNMTATQICYLGVMKFCMIMCSTQIRWSYLFFNYKAATTKKVVLIW